MLCEPLTVATVRSHIPTLSSNCLRVISPRSKAASQPACSINALCMENRFSFVRDSVYLPAKNALASLTNRSCDDMVNTDCSNAKSCPAHKALWILRNGYDLCDYDIPYVPSQGADASVAPLASLKDLFRMARSAAASFSAPSAYLVLHVTHPDPFCSATIELGVLELDAPVVVPDELFQVLPALSNRYRAS